ncbi:MAG: hypothetical protein R3F37_22250 [Candidatus Competibacteraceae bacterium]
MSQSRGQSAGYLDTKYPLPGVARLRTDSVLDYPWVVTCNGVPNWSLERDLYVEDTRFAHIHYAIAVSVVPHPIADSGGLRAKDYSPDQ